MDDRGAAHPHRHDVLEIGLCGSGAGTFVVDGRAQRFAAGSLAVVSGREFHHARADPGTTATWTFLFCDPAALLPIGDPALETADLRGGIIADTDAVALAQALAAEAARADRPHARAAARGLVLALLAHLHRHATAPAAPDGDLARLAPALRLIAERYGAPLAMTALARACGLRPSAFRARFAAALGKPPKEYLTDYRLHRAALLLRDPQAGVLETALAVGFAGPSGFHRAWKDRYGAPPRATRRR